MNELASGRNLDAGRDTYVTSSAPLYNARAVSNTKSHLKSSERRNHYIPRSFTGRVAVVLFLLFFALTQPPLVFWLANRINPVLLGMPFLYVFLLADYFILIGILIWARKKGV